MCEPRFLGSHGDGCSVEVIGQLNRIWGPSVAIRSDRDVGEPAGAVAFSAGTFPEAAKGMRTMIFPLVLAASMNLPQAAYAQETAQQERSITRDCLWYADHSVEQALNLNPDQVAALDDIRRRYPRQFGSSPNLPSGEAQMKRVQQEPEADPRMRPQYDAQGRQLPTANTPQQPTRQEEFDQMDNTQNPPLGSSDGVRHDPPSNVRTDGSDAALQMELQKALTAEQLQQWRWMCDGRYEKDKKKKRHSSVH
jgi:hypothetical protein